MEIYGELFKGNIPLHLCNLHLSEDDMLRGCEDALKSRDQQLKFFASTKAKRGCDSEFLERHLPTSQPRVFGQAEGYYWGYYGLRIVWSKYSEVVYRRSKGPQSSSTTLDTHLDTPSPG
ncbi:hypothetical protein O3M35_005198 [Rhynocoris fuscipes]|uniref:Uncharacterized protein n=1 Tax=Rhynocoris fuscipes TaxID=488301 RepID=A0AAW1DHT9_9HEMI